MECKKIRIACDDMSGTTAYGEFKEFVVFCVAASRDVHSDIHPFSLARQCCDKRLDIVLIEVALQVLSAQYVVKFGEYCIREKDFPLEKRQIESFARLGIRQEQGADENIGIENETQLFAF